MMTQLKVENDTKKRNSRFNVRRTSCTRDLAGINLVKRQELQTSRDELEARHRSAWL